LASSRKVLRPLQARVLDELRRVASRFFLSGGAALGGYHLGHRLSDDIDLFVTDDDALQDVSRALEAACRSSGLACELRRDAPSFRRYAVEDSAGERTLVDVVVDTAPPVEAEKALTDGIRVDGLEDLVANKLCALLGRSSVKDLVDLYFIERAGIDVVSRLDSAARKDLGMDAAVLARVVAETRTDPSALVMAAPVTESELAAFRDALVERLLRKAFPR